MPKPPKLVPKPPKRSTKPLFWITNAFGFLGNEKQFFLKFLLESATDGQGLLSRIADIGLLFERAAEKSCYFAAKLIGEKNFWLMVSVKIQIDL